MRTPLILLALLGGAYLVSDSAVSSPAALLSPELPAALPSLNGSYTVDPGHSGALFRVSHMGVSNFWGRFNKVEGTFVLAADAKDCTVSIVIDAGSVDTNSEGRDKHVRGPELFNAAEYPEITFDSERVTIDGDSYTVQGQLTLLGKSQPVTIPMQKIGEADTRMGARCGFEGDFTFDRKDFGMTALEGAIGSEIRCILFIEAIKK